MTSHAEANRVVDAALVASEERLRLATDAASLGIWVWDVIRDEMTWESDRLYEMFGVPRTGKPMNGAAWLAQVVHPDDARAFEHAVAHTLGAGERFYFLGRFRRGDGAIRWAELTGLLHRTAEGEPRYLVGTGADVTERKEAEEAVRQTARESAHAAEANAKFRTLFEQGTQFGAMLSLDGVLVEANRLSSSACGFRREEVIGRAFWECGWWSGSPEVAAQIREACVGAASGRSFHGESRYFHADGSERIVDLVIAPVSDDAGRILFVAATGVDITERKHAEERLRRTDERLKLLVDNTKDYLVSIQDPSGVVVEWQGGAERITGFCAAEAVGQGAELLFTPEDRAAGVPSQEMERARETGRAEDKRWHARKDGTRWFADGVMTALYGEGGKLRGFGKVARDATAQKRAEDALKDREERLVLLDALGEATRSASDATAIMAATTRLVGEYLKASRCAYAHVEPDNDCFTIHDDWTAPGVASSVGVYVLDGFGRSAAADMRAGRTLVIRDVEREPEHTGGIEAMRRLGARALICCPLVRDQRLIAMMAVHDVAPREWAPRDVALLEQVVERSWAHIERVRATEALREQHRRKDEFLATLAHELRNPLAPIRTGLQVLSMDPSPEAAARTRATMDRQLGHMVRLIDDLLDISRISRGKFQLRHEPVKVQAVLEHAVEAVRPLLEAAAHRLDVDMPAEPIWVVGDLTRLAQVVQNLLNNAVKYTSSGGGRIELSAFVDGGDVVIRVADNGMGIARDKIAEVFDLFRQVNRTLDRAQGGLGIGLSLVRDLVEMHGGTVTARSAGVGQGSTFEVRLRLDAARHVEGDAPPQLPRATERAPHKRVLVVDDNVDGAEMLATMLDLGGYETRTATDGPDALVAARTFAPDVVFLDIGMPGMDGFEVARHMRADPQLRRAVLVALTGWGSADDRRRTKEAGFDFHLTKPVETSAVTSLLTEIAR